MTPDSAAPGKRARFADVALATLVLTIVGMMIVPLPTALLDVLLAANISLGVLLLLVALYVRSGLELSSFPTILLVTTLFRLALNVSSTRLVLLQADAGEVIRAFGEFVVRGNYVVGGVIFALLTLIQFLVIAKGSERVAEVGARFTLDAMPGKQMAIDAELRSGALDSATARRKRSELSRESQFYGAMDGAMKFVKGDAIAGIVITCVNLLGGLIVGAWMHDMSAGDALRTYGLLTIGDGLVSQIPALLISTAAGLVVTRVASESPDGSLGRDVAEQVFGHPKALRVAGTFLLVLAVVPGLPAMPFLLLGGLALATALRLARVAPARAATAASSETRDPDASAHLVPVVAPLSIELHGRDASAVADAVRAQLPALRERLFLELGLLLPAVRVRGTDGPEPLGASVAVQEVPFSRLEAPDAEAALAELGRAVRSRAEELIGLQETQELLDRLENVLPAVVKNVVPKPIPLPLLAEILRRLVGEGVSIRPLREILETLAAHGQTERDPVELVELTRVQLRRHVVRPLVRGGALTAVLVDPAVEEAVRDAIRRTPNGSYLALPPGVARDILDAVTRALGDAADCSVLLGQSDVRRFLRRLIENDLPGVRVLSYAELPPDLVVTPIGRVEL